MAPIYQSQQIAERLLRITRRAVAVAGPDIAKLAPHIFLARRGLTVNTTQQITLGVIAAYVVVIALLWNLPYVRWSLWPFKVSNNTKANGRGHALRGTAC
jgi:hypothetical protein